MSKHRIVSTSAKGRSVFANVRIKGEETIFTEEPLVSAQFSWNKACRYVACEHCMCPLETAEANIRRLAGDPSIELPHPECDPTSIVPFSIVQCEKYCASALFCGEECRKKAEIYHKSMCDSFQAVDRINEIWKKMHYPPETATVLLILRMFAMIKTNPAYLETFNEFCSNSVNEDLSLIHKVLGEKFTSQLDQLHKAFVEWFGGDKILAPFLTLEGLTRLFSMIGTNSQGIGTSSFAGWVKNISELENLDDQQKTEMDELIDTLYATLDQTVGMFMNSEGSGLYVQQSKINHSCSPNAEIRFPFSNNIAQVTALRDISPDEEICISYLDECQLRQSRHSRQKFLKENYLFVCDCAKCESEIEQPDVSSDEGEEDEDDEMES